MLPLGPPYSKAYPHNAYQLAILGCNDETRAWLFMNYIHLVSEVGNRDNPVEFHSPDDSGYNRSIMTPWFDHSMMTRDFVKQCKLDFGGIIHHAILNKNYVFLSVNEKYIPGTLWHAKGMDYSHSLLLHGYDQTTNEVFFLIYDTNRSLTVRSIPMRKLEQAYFDNKFVNERIENRMYFIKLREDIGLKPSFNLKYVIEQLVSYRDETYLSSNVLDCRTHDKYRYGLAVYDSFIDQLNKDCRGSAEGVQERIIIPLHLLMEHKNIMVKRMNFIAERYPQLDLGPLLGDFENLSKAFESLRNIALKFELTGNPIYLSKIIVGITELKEKERNALTRLINCLSGINNYEVSVTEFNDFNE